MKQTPLVFTDQDNTYTADTCAVLRGNLLQALQAFLEGLQVMAQPDATTPPELM